MNELEAIFEIKDKCHTKDEEVDHERADDIICNFLNGLGYTELVDAFQDVKKYYA